MKSRFLRLERSSIKDWKKALLKASAEGDLGEEASICHQIGKILSDTGRHLNAIRYFKSDLEICQTIGDKAGEALANRGIANCYVE